MPTNVTLWPPSFDAAIFDFDGTIAATGDIWTHVDQVFLGTRGIAYTEEYGRALAVLGFDRGARYTIDLYNLPDSEEDVVEEWRRLSLALYRSEVVLRPGAHSYIQRLRERGIRCALATTNERMLIETIEHVDVSSLFDACVYGAEVGKPKDEPDIYLEAARLLDARPDGCIVFEDIAPALRTAAGAGFATCAVRTEDSRQEWDAMVRVADLALESWEDLAR